MTLVDADGVIIWHNCACIIAICLLALFACHFEDFEEYIQVELLHLMSLASRWQDHIIRVAEDRSNGALIGV